MGDAPTPEPEGDPTKHWNSVVGARARQRPRSWRRALSGDDAEFWISGGAARSAVPMSDPSPDTPNVLPDLPEHSQQHANSDAGGGHRRHCGRLRHGPCPDEWARLSRCRVVSPDVTARRRTAERHPDIDAHATRSAQMMTDPCRAAT